ncbi:type VI secretion system membrane subunit TssM [Vibrio algivorus]|uniref:Type VI secretion system membrane subunit TssM n=1 Tax=Vibrio algivorus TaxID=1667024 RepID=A0A557P5J1_9VIBR|nr:type VI secretion system membrane subunit TssM [Vibrio algivorus]TVO35879.1 type VI secretion system membrane subunit TssM [Vibrio algivorus]
MWKLITGIGQKLKPAITAAIPILLFSLFVLVNIAIWWMGPWLTINEVKPLSSYLSRGVTSLLFSLMCFSSWGVWQWRKLVQIKDDEKREQELKSDPFLQSEERQELELNQVMQTMKSNLNKSNYLYSLPWYLVLGLENAGKTSLINRSGQSFVFSSVMRASHLKSGNPYSFDWWIGDESVLIDPDGELLTQGGLGNDVDPELSRRLWVHFTRWLEKTRNRRPLNGIVLAIDIAHLAKSKESERKAYANLLRTRLRELMETLSTRLPVYVSFTKFDLLHGFEPFFRSYTKEQREDVLGFTFSLDSVNDLDHWLTEYMAHYDEFVARINAAIPHIMVNLTNSEERNAVYSFTRQLAGLKDTIYRLLDEVLGSDQFSTSPLVRGVYFTSVFQQGVAINAFDNATSRRYGLRHAINTAQHAKNSTIYFTQKLFNQIVYPEAGLASDNFKVAKKKRRIIFTSVLVCSVASLLLISAWQRYYSVNVSRADRVLQKVNEYQALISGNHGMLSHKDMLEPLNKIREATLEFGFFRDKLDYVSDLGLYQGHTIGPKVEETYLNLLEYKFLPLLMADVIQDLNHAQSDEEKLTALRVYRMMVDASGRHSEFVLDYFAKSWQRQFTGQRKTQNQLLEHLDYAMQHTDLTKDRKEGNEAADQLMAPYDLLISRVQNELGRMPNEERVYRNLKLSAKTLLGPAVNLRNLIGPVFDIVYQEGRSSDSSLYIPKFLTKEGFESYFMPQSESVSKLALIDGWVLGQSSTAEFSEEDKRELRAKIRDLYVADYTNTWRQALNHLDIKRFSDINEAVTIVDNIMGNLEPVQRLLKTVDTNTNFFAALPDDAAAKEALIKSPKFNVASMIDKPFSDLNSLSYPNGDNPAYIQEVLDVVGQLHDYLKAIQDSPNVGMSALNATKERVKLQSIDPIYTLRRVASGLPNPLNRMMKTLSDQSWYVVKKEAIRYLEVRWQDDVYKPYQEKLAGKYPLSPSSKQDVALSDFEAFFAPNGTLETFYNDQLELFLNENISIADTHDETASIVSQKVIDELAQAKQIQQAFFNRKGALDIEFSLQPLVLSGNKRRSAIDLDGQYLMYTHGQRDTVELIWPNSLSESASSKVTLVPVQTGYSPRSISAQGSWSFFRLLDKARVVSASSGSVDYKFTVDDGSMVYRLNSDNDNNPFTNNLFKSFKLSKSLY